MNDSSGTRIKKRNDIDFRPMKSAILDTISWMEDYDVDGLESFKRGVSEMSSVGQIMFAKDMLSIIARIYATSPEIIEDSVVEDSVVEE